MCCLSQLCDYNQKMGPVEGRNVRSMFLTRCLAAILGLKLLVFFQLYRVPKKMTYKWSRIQMSRYKKLLVLNQLRIKTGKMFSKSGLRNTV